MFAAKHCIYLKYVHEEMTREEKEMVKLFGDNNQATILAQEEMVISENGINTYHIIGLKKWKAYLSRQKEGQRSTAMQTL